MSAAAKDDAGKPVRLGVIGVGIMGSNHARVLADLSGVKVVGIADPGAAHRELLGQIRPARCATTPTPCSISASMRR